MWDSKGQKQKRCPLSPPLFISVLEVLNREIKKRWENHGSQILKRNLSVKGICWWPTSMYTVEFNMCQSDHIQWFLEWSSLQTQGSPVYEYIDIDWYLPKTMVLNGMFIFGNLIFFDQQYLL